MQNVPFLCTPMNVYSNYYHKKPIVRWNHNTIWAMNGAQRFLWVRSVIGHSLKAWGIYLWEMCPASPLVPLFGYRLLQLSTYPHHPVNITMETLKIEGTHSFFNIMRIDHNAPAAVLPSPLTVPLTIQIHLTRTLYFCCCCFPSQV